MKKKRLCILVATGWGIRNVLMSKAMLHIQPHTEIHVFSPFEGLPNFRQRFAKLGRQEKMLQWRPGKLETLLYILHEFNFYKAFPTPTHKYRLYVKYYQERTKRKPLIRLIQLIGNHTFFRWSQKALLQYWRRSAVYRSYRQYFQQHGIATLLSTYPISYLEHPAAVAAKDLGLRTMALITSWDNICTKPPLIIDFDDYLVWNQVMAAEIDQFYLPRGKRRVHRIGPLQFDFYFQPAASTREQFCQHFGFDPDRKIVVYSTVTPILFPDEDQLIAKFLLALKAGRIHGQPNFLIRAHPKRADSEFRNLQQDPRWHNLRVAWSAAGANVRAQYDRWCPLDDEIQLLTATVQHGDVNINAFSTMLLDFACLGKPAVLIAHDSQDRAMPFTVNQHLQPIMQHRTHLIGHCFEESLQHLNAYLQNPNLDAQQRQMFVQMQCENFLGRSWQRLSEVLLADDR